MAILGEGPFTKKDILDHKPAFFQDIFLTIPAKNYIDNDNHSHKEIIISI